MAERESPPSTPPAETPASPVTARTQSLVAVLFVLVWLGLEVWDFVLNGNAPVLPLWWHMAGLLVLGFILGMNVPSLIDYYLGRGRRHD